MKETIVPQAFLSSLYNTHHNANKTAYNFATRKKCVSRTLSRVFWQQKYFLGNLLLERSTLASGNFSGLFAKLDSQVEIAPDGGLIAFDATSLGSSQH